MKILMVACSVKAHELILDLINKIKSSTDFKTIFNKEIDEKLEIIQATKCKALPNISIVGSLSEYVGEQFEQVDAIIFVCATGIAVRMIAPYIKHKSVDPAVLVIDELGKYCISLLSGHAGGANELCNKISDLIGAMPVVTTATDNENVFAIDEFARKNHLIINDWKLAKEFTASLLNGVHKTIVSDFLIENDDGKNISITYNCLMDNVLDDRINNRVNNSIYNIISNVAENATSYANVDAYIGSRLIPEDNILSLIPQNIVVGIGCRRGILVENVRNAVFKVFSEHNLNLKSICKISSIDIKKDEKGICDFAKEMDVPFETFSSDVLEKCEGTFSASEFVKENVGVDNVCERSAVVAAKEIINNSSYMFDNYNLLIKKNALDGVTIAVVMLVPKLSF